MITRVLPIVLAASLLAVGSTIPASPAHAAVTKIMPLGDSNTEGIDEAHVGYRADLWQLLTSDGRPVDFVGSLSHGSAHLGDLDHEGHGGWTIQGIHDNVIGWLQTYQPDVITLQIGTNDMNTDALANAAPGRLSALLDRIAQTSAQTKVFVTSIPAFRDQVATERARTFNATIPGTVASKAAAGKKVYYVDVGSVYHQPADFGDAVHTTYGASSKGAARWYEAVTGLPTTRYEAEQAAIVHARKDASTSSSEGARVSYLDYTDSSVTFTVNASASGQYRIHLRGSNGTGTPCTHKVAVNGGPEATVTYPSFGTDLPNWRLWTTQGLDVQLNGGTNSIRVAKGACSAELDALDVSGPVVS